MAGPAKTLPVGLQGAIEIDAFAESRGHGGLESGELRIDGCAVLGEHVLL
jgi:hypothetical protein